MNKMAMGKGERRGRKKGMPKNGKRYYSPPELLTKGEIDQAMILYDACKKTKEDFNQRCTEEIVAAVISRVNAQTGYNQRAEYLTYRLKSYLKSVRGEEGVTTAKSWQGKLMAPEGVEYHDKRPKLVTMEEIFTREELERAREIFEDYKGEPRYIGELKVSDEIVKPKISEITKYTGYDDGPEYWACCLSHYFNITFTIMRGQRKNTEEGLTHH